MREWEDSALHAAANLAFANGTGGFVGAGHEEKLKQSFACLYGLNTSFGELTKQELIPRIPDLVAVWDHSRHCFR